MLRSSSIGSPVLSEFAVKDHDHHRITAQLRLELLSRLREKSRSESLLVETGHNKTKKNCDGH